MNDLNVRESRIVRMDRQGRNTREDIQTASWTYMAEHGTAALSLRAVAASIGLSAPALYRYVPDKNRLITALILGDVKGLRA